VSHERSSERRAPRNPVAFFSPDGVEHRYLDFGGRVTWPRLLLRLALAIALLVAIDAVVAKTLTPRAAYEHDYRLPLTLPTSQLADFAESIHDAAITRHGGPIVAFVGASPTWGFRIKDPANTFPAAFSAAGRAAGWPNRTYNLASDGQFLGDEYLIAKGVSPDADVVFVQLTYHTFNPKAREGRAVRYGEIPQLLGLDITPAEAALLGVKASASGHARSRADEFMSRYWLLWRERDNIDRRLFGGKPQNLLAQRPAETSALTSLPAGGAGDAQSIAFDKLAPTQRMAAITRYSETSSFVIAPNDTDVHFLALLAEMLHARGKKAVFFLAPLNRSAVEGWGLIDPAQYAANVAVLRSTVASSGAGFPFLDYNTGPTRLPPADFADISHTTDAGGKAFGELLYRDTWRYLGAAAPQGARQP
jgi:hypothetical protein